MTDKQEGEPTRGYKKQTPVDPTTTKEFREALSKLSGFQRKFVEAYLKSDSYAEAARVAGSTSKTPDKVGWNTMQIPEVQMALAIGMKTRIEAAALDGPEVIAKFREIYDRSMDDGKYSDAFKATEALGKMLGLFQDKGAKGKIAEQVKELREKEEKELDDRGKGMLHILGKAKVREGTADDQRTLLEEVPKQPS